MDEMLGTAQGSGVPFLEVMYSSSHLRITRLTPTYMIPSISFTTGLEFVIPICSILKYGLGQAKIRTPLRAKSIETRTGLEPISSRGDVGWSPFNPTCHYPQSHQFMPISWARVVNRPSEPKACLSPALFCHRAQCKGLGMPVGKVLAWAKPIFKIVCP